MRKLRHKGAKGSKTLSRADVRELFASNSLTTALGVVRLFDGESSHYEIVDGEPLVDVELVPNGDRVLCRLGFGSRGVYRIPPVDSEVAVIIPAATRSLIADDLDSDPIIVAVLEDTMPAEVDGDDVIVIKGPRVKIIATEVSIEATGADPVAIDAALDVGGAGGIPLTALDELVHGTGIEPLTGQTFKALGATTANVRAKK